MMFPFIYCAYNKADSTVKRYSNRCQKSTPVFDVGLSYQFYYNLFSDRNKYQKDMILYLNEIHQKSGLVHPLYRRLPQMCVSGTVFSGS